MKLYLVLQSHKLMTIYTIKRGGEGLIPPSHSASSPTFSRQSHLPIRSNRLPLCIFFSELPFFDNITSLKYGINRIKTFRENYSFMINRLKTLHAVVISNTRLRFELKDSLCSSASLPLIP